MPGPTLRRGTPAPVAAPAPLRRSLCSTAAARCTAAHMQAWRSLPLLCFCCHRRCLPLSPQVSLRLGLPSMKHASVARTQGCLWITGTHAFAMPSPARGLRRCCRMRCCCILQRQTCMRQTATQQRPRLCTRRSQRRWRRQQKRRPLRLMARHQLRFSTLQTTPAVATHCHPRYSRADCSLWRLHWLMPTCCNGAATVGCNIHLPLWQLTHTDEDLLQDLKKQEEGSLVWIQYQRFSRRSEGVRASRQVLSLLKLHRLSHPPSCAFRMASPSPAAAHVAVLIMPPPYTMRQVFLRARKSPAAGWHVYAASARLEWAGDKNEKVRPPC